MKTTRVQKISAGVFYGLSSYALAITTKVLLSKYRFVTANILILWQVSATLFFSIISFKCRQNKLTSRPNFTSLLIIASLGFANVLAGVVSTRSLSLPMFTALRRFSLLITMLGEAVILKKRYGRLTAAAVGLMVFGSIVAYLDDLSYTLSSYAVIMVNNVLTSAYTISLKKVREEVSLVLLVNSCLALVLSLPLVFLERNLLKDMLNEFGTKPRPWPFFLLVASNCVLSFSIHLALILCTRLNSPLTTNAVGCLKNIATAYSGILVGGDYTYSFYNFIGINISIFGGILYAFSLT